jgi:hypothetical protein
MLIDISNMEKYMWVYCSVDHMAVSKISIDARRNNNVFWEGSI